MISARIEQRGVVGPPLSALGATLGAVPGVADHHVAVLHLVLRCTDSLSSSILLTNRKAGARRLLPEERSGASRVALRHVGRRCMFIDISVLVVFRI